MTMEALELALEFAPATATEERMTIERQSLTRRWDRRRVLGRDGRKMHADSLAALAQNRKIMTGDMLAVYGWLRVHGPATDRQVRDGLYPGHDMNKVRPRISDLVNIYHLAREVREVREVGSRVPVRVVEAIEN
ncbi:MAG: hypothetical protein PHR35_08600 [Kiritimatiellae bacterium]|nr:hypothetical protein [Kiritimatiellia bacterium]